MKKVLSLLLVALFLFTACEEQMVIIPEVESTTSTQKILIEEFTGGNCSACPQGAAAIKDLETLYPENIISVAIHTTAVGVIGDPANGAEYNFQTSYGDDIANYLGPLTSIPAASIDRTLFEGYDLGIIPFTAWSGLTTGQLDKTPEALLNAKATYDSNTNQIKVSGDIIADQKIEGDVRIVGYITESHIMDKQLKGTEVIDYEHNHVLRSVLSWGGQDVPTIEGNSLATPIAQDQIVPFEFDTFEMPEGTDGELLWKAEHCHVIVFIARFDGETGSREVLQVDEVDFLQ